MSALPPASQALALGLAWKSTVLLATVLIIVWAVARRRASVAAAVANVGLLGLVVLPLWVLAMPALEVPCLPARGGGPVTVPHPPIAPVPVADRPGVPAEAGRPELAADISPDIDRVGGEASGRIEGDGPDPSRPTRRRVPWPAAPVPPATSSLTGQPVAWATIGVIIYALVVAVLMLRLTGGLIAVARLRRGAVAVDDPAWRAVLGRWRTRLGIGRPVGLAWSAGVEVPVVVGWRRPMVLLPASASALDTLGHADAILLHELAHVRRDDYAWNLLQRLAVALYWIHPLAWPLARAASEARERACDDLCVHEMGGPSSYRATLLEVASGLVRRPGPALGLAMARPSRLARRLAAIDGSRGSSRCLPRWPARLAIALVGLAAFGLVGAARLTRAQGRAAADEPPVARAEPKAQAEAAPGKVFHLQVVSADTGRPVPRANVRATIGHRDEWKTTDDQGRLDIPHSTGPGDKDLDIDVWGDGFAMQRHDWGPRYGVSIPDGVTLKLQPGETLGGVVQDEQGRPIGGATVYLWSHNYKRKDPRELLFDLRAVTGSDGRWTTSGAPETTGELLSLRVLHPDYLSERDYDSNREKPKIADLRAGKGVSVMTKGVPIEGRVLDADGRPVAGATVLSSPSQDRPGPNLRPFAVTTDEAGRFRTGQVRAQEWFLLATAKGHAPGERSIRVSTAIPQVEIRLGRPRRFAGRVVDPDGKPIAGASVNVDSWRRYRFLDVFLYTDRDGRFLWDDAPDDPLEISAWTPGYHRVSRQRVEPSEADVTFTLRPSLSINGRVFDAETKKGVEAATVEYGAVEPKTGDVPKWTGLPTPGASGGVHQGRFNVDIPVTAAGYRLRVVAEGYQPFVSRVFRRDEAVIRGYDITLIPAGPGGTPVATALRPDGKPLVGARVYRGVLNERELSLHDGAVQAGPDSGRELRTGPDGTFAIPPLAKPWMVLILGDDCYGYASQQALEASPRVQTRPFARVEGRYLIGDRAGANVPVQLYGHIQNRSTSHCVVFTSQQTTTDGEGRFRFEKVIPTNNLRVARRDRGGRAPRSWSLGAPVRVEPGATATVTLGGQGRPVVGRVELPEGWTDPVDFTDNARASFESNRPRIPFPPSLYRGKTSFQDTGQSEWLERWRESPEGRDYSDRREAGAVDLSPDGSFRFDDVPPGEYRLSIGVNERPPSHEADRFDRLGSIFTVPPIPGGRSDEVLDLGIFRLRRKVSLKSGDPAPAFEVATVDGRKLAVPGDFKGKVLLLDFGAIWEQQSTFQIARLNDVHKRFGDDPRFTILSLTLAADSDETRRYIAEKGEPWPQAIIGPLSNPITSAYGVNDENVFGSILIGPEGKLIATGLYYDKIGKAVGEALGRK
jgi:beta-lactamase regulating signal transducer with metallopeptidase domain